MGRRFGPGALLWLLSLAPAWAQDAVEPAPQQQEQQAQAEQAEEEKEQAGGLRFVFRRRPSIRVGRMLRVDFRTKFQFDFRGFEPELPTPEGLYDIHRFRVGVQGHFLRHFEYEVEREIRDVFRDLFEEVEEGERTRNPWKDVYVNFRYFRDFQIRVGKFKVPFGMEQLTGPTNLDFPYRALISSQLAPGRDKGIAMHGRFFRRRLNYEAGLFRNDGENAFFSDVVDAEGTRERFKTGLRTFAGRVWGEPLRLLHAPRTLRGMELGGAFASTTVPEGLKGVRGRTISGDTFFRHIFVHGQRLRLGTELNWNRGPFSVKSEFMHVRDERRNQGIRSEDLPDLISRGWYLSGTWVVTGQRHTRRDEPKGTFPLKGPGAVELAGRYEQIRFGSAEHIGRPQRTPRASNILSSSDRVWTFGINWYLNRFMKIQVNAIREKLEDIQRSPLSDKQLFWIRVARIQFVM